MSPKERHFSNESAVEYLRLLNSALGEGHSFSERDRFFVEWIRVNLSGGKIAAALADMGEDMARTAQLDREADERRAKWEADLQEFLPPGSRRKK